MIEIHIKIKESNEKMTIQAESGIINNDNSTEEEQRIAHMIHQAIETVGEVLKIQHGNADITSEVLRGPEVHLKDIMNDGQLGNN